MARVNEYTTLGRSGLLVSPFCLGTMTFGTEWGWGATEDTSRAIFDLSSLDFTIPSELRARLDEVSAPASMNPYTFFEPFLQRMIHGDAPVRAWSPSAGNGQASSAQEREQELLHK